MMSIINHLRNRYVPVGDARPGKCSNLLATFRPAELWSWMAVAALSFVSGIADGALVSQCPSELLVLDRPAFEKLVKADNSVAIALLMALGKAQGNNLRWSAMEINRLAQW